MKEPTNEQKTKRLNKVMDMLKEKQKTIPVNIKNLTNELAKIPTEYSYKTFIKQVGLAQKAAVLQGELRITNELLKPFDDGKGELTFDDLNVTLKSFNDQIYAEFQRNEAMIEGVTELSPSSSDAEQTFWINTMCDISRSRGSLEFIQKIVMIMLNRKFNLFV